MGTNALSLRSSPIKTDRENTEKKEPQYKVAGFYYQVKGVFAQYIENRHTGSCTEVSAKENVHKTGRICLK